MSLLAVRSLGNRAIGRLLGPLGGTQRSMLHSSRVIGEAPKITTDPHVAAAERIAANKSSERMQVAEALGQVDYTIRLQNIALATALAGFVTGVFWYSVSAVGGNVKGGSGADAGALRELEEAAAEARILRAENLREEEQLKGLLSGDAEDELDEDDFPRKPAKGKPLWKRIVFFWRRE